MPIESPTREDVERLAQCLDGGEHGDELAVMMNGHFPTQKDRDAAFALRNLVDERDELRERVRRFEALNMVFSRREPAALRAQLEELEAEKRQLVNQLADAEFAKGKLEAENAELRKDKARLDYIIGHGIELDTSHRHRGIVYYRASGIPVSALKYDSGKGTPSYREAIDAAMEDGE